MIRKLLRLLEDVFPGLQDEILVSLGAVWDIFGFFSPVVGLIAVALAIALGIYTQSRLLLRRLPKMVEHAKADEMATPVLEVAARPSRLKRFLRRRDYLTSVRIDHDGMIVDRLQGNITVVWAQVAQWSRNGLASWDLTLRQGNCSLGFTDKDRLSRADLKRIDQRIALYVSGLPRSTIGDEMRRGASQLVRWLNEQRFRLRRTKPTVTNTVAPPDDHDR